MIHPIVGWVWAAVCSALVLAAVWTGGGSTSEHLTNTACFVIVFGVITVFCEALRRDL